MKTEHPCRWGEARYHTLQYHLKHTFGCRLYKLPLDGGMSCPNRDGTLDTRGCIFCLDGSVAPGMRLTSIPEQIRFGKAQIAHKVPENARYIAYFQSHTNTWAPDRSDPEGFLRRLFFEAVEQPEIAVLSVATRPDCLNDAICDLLAECNQIKPVWVELGLQSAHEKTARWMRRGYDNPVFEAAVKKLHARSISIIVHLILGMPGETIESECATIRYLNQLPIDGVKFHLLYVSEGTDLAEEYRAGNVFPLTQKEYADHLLACLEELSPDTVVHRITGDGGSDTLLAPRWSLDKKNVLNYLRHEMKVRDSWQSKRLSGNNHDQDCLGQTEQSGTEKP